MDEFQVAQLVAGLVFLWTRPFLQWLVLLGGPTVTERRPGVA